MGSSSVSEEILMRPEGPRRYPAPPVKTNPSMTVKMVISTRKREKVGTIFHRYPCIKLGQICLALRIKASDPPQCP